MASYKKERLHYHYHRENEGDGGGREKGERSEESKMSNLQWEILTS